MGEKDAHQTICRNSNEENKSWHKGMRNKVKKVDLKVMREKAEEALTELKDCPCGMIRQVRVLKIESM